ncbi:hypothetical protein UB31_08465 [Bradyrhizobium sp. LTSP849]|nr:hypothetical protein UB31_08465 [Bradyrhizobium sp. LTSP849]
MASRQVLLARERSAEVVYTTWACVVEDDRFLKQMGARSDGRQSRFRAKAGPIGPESQPPASDPPNRRNWKLEFR